MTDADDGRGEGRSGVVVVVALIVFAAALASIAYFGQPVVRLKPATAVTTPLVAVFPFHNLAGDEALEVVASDVTLAVIESLSGLEGLRVVPRAAVLELRELEGGLEEAARRLEANYALAGSVERLDGRLRVQAYLVQPGERPRIWADELFFEPDEVTDVPAGRGRSRPHRLRLRLRQVTQAWPRHRAATDSGAPRAGRRGSP